MATNKLSSQAVKRAKPKEKDYKMADGGGMFLLVKTNGSKYWRYKYRYAGKEKLLALGVYPDTTLERARALRNNAKSNLLDDIDPSLIRKKEKLTKKYKTSNTFEAVARDWVKRKSHEWTPGHTEDVLKSLQANIFPKAGSIPITELDSVMLRSALESVQARGALEATKRLRQRCSAIFRYGQALGVCSDDPADCLKEILLPPIKKNYAALQIEELPQFLDLLNKYNCNTQTRLAMRLMMLTFVRTSELIEARWSEIDFKKAIWNIPAERMKRRRPHYIPLSIQTLDTLQRLQTITGHWELMLPKRGKPREPMSNATILRVIERLGYKGRMTGHGFRSIASTALNESGLFRPDAIERQLSHEQNDDVRAAYNRAEYYQERVEMMQWWANRLDSLENENKVIPIKTANHTKN